MKKVNCPGHTGKCKFCKREHGFPRYVGQFVQVDQFTREPKIDYCCKACASNESYARKKFDPIVNSIFNNRRVPRGEDIA